MPPGDIPFVLSYDLLITIICVTYKAALSVYVVLSISARAISSVRGLMKRVPRRRIFSLRDDDDDDNNNQPLISFKRNYAARYVGRACFERAVCGTEKERLAPTESEVQLERVIF